MNIIYRRIITHLKPQPITRRFNNKTTFNGIKFSTMFIIGSATSIVAFAPFENSENNFVLLLGGVIRFLRSVKIGMVISFDYTFSKMGLNESDPNYKIMMSRIHQRAANSLLDGCLNNGGTYIKLGQGLVCMSHILPAEYTETLKQLQDKCLTRKPDEVRQLFLADFGKAPEEMFKYFNAEAIAAASLAQVFRAKTQDDRDVAVKVQYIDLQSRFKSDVSTIEFILTVIGILHKDFNFSWMLKDLTRSLKQELDFKLEGQNSERCAKDLRHLEYVYVPKVTWELCSSRVLVTEFINGYKISDIEALKSNGFSLADIDRKLFEAFGEQIFQTGFVHADPHSGNVLIRKNNGKTQLVLLDHGLYEITEEKDRIALSNMWKAIILNDHGKMKKYSKELGVDDYEMFAEILTQTPLRTTNFKLTTKLTEEDVNYMKDFASNRFNAVMAVLKDMPKTLLLILRNLNTIRSIAHDHGNPIDRYEVLARAATKKAFDSEQSIIKKVTNIPLKIYFEVKLIVNKISVLFQRTFLRILHRLGRSVDQKFLLEHIG